MHEEYEALLVQEQADGDVLDDKCQRLEQQLKQSGLLLSAWLLLFFVLYHILACFLFCVCSSFSYRGAAHFSS